jgi:hypothetical protein
MAEVITGILYNTILFKWRVAVYILNRCTQLTWHGTQVCGLDEVLASLHCKTLTYWTMCY